MVGLQREFKARRKELLAARVARQRRLDAGERPDFLPETAGGSRGGVDGGSAACGSAGPAGGDYGAGGSEDDHQCAELGGAKVFMADFEDSTTPTWENVLDGQLNLRDAVRRTITFERCDDGKELQADGEAGGAVCAGARVASGGAACAGGWRGDVGVALRLWPVLLP